MDCQLIEEKPFHINFFFLSFDNPWIVKDI